MRFLLRTGGCRESSVPCYGHRLEAVFSQEPTRKEYADKVRATYNYRFGKDQLFLPGTMQVEGDDFVQPGAFPERQYCAHCHQEAYHQWRQALHSNAFRTPFYRASVNILIRTKGIEFSRHCDSCHNPIAVLAGGLTEDSKVDRRIDQDGLTCATCHSIQKLKSTKGNGGFVMGIPSVMVDEKGNRIPGEVPYDEIYQASGAPLASGDARVSIGLRNSVPPAIRPICRIR